MTSDVQRRYQQALDAERKAFNAMQDAKTGSPEAHAACAAWQQAVAETDLARSALFKSMGQPPASGGTG